MMMTKCWLPLIVVTLLVGADEPKKDETAKDVEQFQGTWTLTSLRNNGTDAPADEVKGRRLIVKGDDATFMQGKEVYSRSAQKLDAIKNPRQIDITQKEGPEKGKTTRGIYMLDGDTLVICYVYPGDGRPSEFKADKDSGCILLKFQREKK